MRQTITGKEINMNKLKNLNIFKLSIASSLLIVAVSMAYFVVIFLPSQQAVANRQFEIESDQVKSIPTSVPTLTPTVSESKKVDTLSLLNQCLSSARTERDRINGELLRLFDEGQTIHRSAFESNDELYEQDRQDCFAKFPQQ